MSINQWLVIGFATIIAGWLLLHSVMLGVLRTLVERAAQHRLCDHEPCKDTSHDHFGYPFTIYTLGEQSTYLASRGGTVGSDTPTDVHHETMGPVYRDGNYPMDAVDAYPIKDAHTGEPGKFGLYQCNHCQKYYRNYQFDVESVWTRAIIDVEASIHLLRWDDFKDLYVECVNNLRKV